MDKGWLYFRKSDRKVLVLLLIACFVVATVLVVFFSEHKNDENRIEKPEHWWETNNK